jgi:hypothetical protein
VNLVSAVPLYVPLYYLRTTLTHGEGTTVSSTPSPSFSEFLAPASFPSFPPFTARYGFARQHAVELNTLAVRTWPS